MEGRCKDHWTCHENAMEMTYRKLFNFNFTVVKTKYDQTPTPPPPPPPPISQSCPQLCRKSQHLSSRYVCTRQVLNNKASFREGKSYQKRLQHSFNFKNAIFFEENYGIKLGKLHSTSLSPRLLHLQHWMYCITSTPIKWVWWLACVIYVPALEHQHR